MLGSKHIVLVFLSILLLSQCGLMKPEWFILMEKARISCAEGQLEASDGYYKRASSLANSGSNPIYDGGYGVPASFSGQIASLADCYAQQNQFERAKTLFLQAISLQPDGGYDWGLAQMYLDFQKYQDAELILEKLLTRANSLPRTRFRENFRSLEETFFMLGKSYEGSTKIAKAENCYQESLRLSKNSTTYPFRLMEIGKFYLRQNNIDKAKKFVNSAISERIEKSTIKILTPSEQEFLAEIACAEKKFDMAEKLLLEALKKYDSSVPIKEKIDTEIKYVHLLRTLNRQKEAEALSRTVKDHQTLLKQLELRRGHIYNIYK